MKNLAIEVWDVTGSRKQPVNLPADAPANRLIAVLFDRLSLPRLSPDARPMSYKLEHDASRRQLCDDQTLASAAVKTGDILRLQLEITAGTEDAPGPSIETSKELKKCPYCGEWILAAARKCRHCEEYLDPELRRARATISAAERLVMPVGRPISAIAAGYLGLLSLLPFVGIIAIIVSLVALWTLKRNPNLYGRGRAWFGLIMGIGTTALYAIAITLA
jgi:hypothetical protein